jgi:GNAT superfamily N-acetyltransferase
MGALASDRTDSVGERAARDASPQLIIRPARPDDRPAMERICAHTWEHGDYIPEVWDDWLADERGVLQVGELNGRVVALNKVTFLTPDQVWLEGMRVDPEYRQQGIGWQFMEHDLADARERGARVVRLGTGGHNQAVHALTARAGMERVGSYVRWSAEPLPDGQRPAILATEHAGLVRAFLQGSPVLAHSRGLYSVHWVWQELSTEQAIRFLGAGQVAAQRAPDGGLAALATIHLAPDDEMWIGFADGEPSAVTTLAVAIRAQAAQAGALRVGVMLPDVAWLRDAFGAAGYGFGDWEGELWIFERRLAPRNGDGHDG